MLTRQRLRTDAARVPVEGARSRARRDRSCRFPVGAVGCGAARACRFRVAARGQEAVAFDTDVAADAAAVLAADPVALRAVLVDATHQVRALALRGRHDRGCPQTSGQLAEFSCSCSVRGEYRQLQMVLRAASEAVGRGVVMGAYDVARRPCSSCPYRRDTPPGVWAPEEYERLAAWDRPMHEQPRGVFLCHTNDDVAVADDAGGDGSARPVCGSRGGAVPLMLCRGWVDVHGADALGVRLATVRGDLDPAVLDEEPAVEVYGSGSEAAAAGIAGVESPSEEAVATIRRLRARHPRLR